MALQEMEDRDGTGRTWIQSTLQYLLVNPYYTGSYISNKTIETVVGGKGKVRRDNSGERGQLLRPFGQRARKENK